MSLIKLFNVVQRAGRIQRSLGTRCAAGYCRNQGLSLNEALLTLGFPVRNAQAQ